MSTSCSRKTTWVLVNTDLFILIWPYIWKPSFLIDLQNGQRLYKNSKIYNIQMHNADLYYSYMRSLDLIQHCSSARLEKIQHLKPLYKPKFVSVCRNVLVIICNTQRNRTSGWNVACFLYNLKEGEISKLRKRLFKKKANTAKVSVKLEWLPPMLPTLCYHSLLVYY